MRIKCLVRLAAFACIAAFGAKDAIACRCGSGIHGRTPLENAKLEAENSVAIFEGTPQRFELQWGILSAKEGELIAADMGGLTPSSWPHMVITFQVQRTYKGQLGPEVQVTTGLGGGDCGAGFAPGLGYLIYGSGSNVRELVVSMCSPGGWIGSKNVETDLRYLRNERPTPADLIHPKHWTQLTPKEASEEDEQRQRNVEEFQKRYAAVTGRVCGTIIRDNPGNGHPVNISFLSTEGYSPVDHPVAQVNQDGSFCSERLGPGKYYLFLTRGSDDGALSALYYPGTSERGRATTITVSAGQDQSGLVLKFVKEETYSVRGFLSTNDNSGLAGNKVSVMLLNLDGDRQTWYTETVDFQGSFPLPRTKYFKFENVVPGHYIAFASVSSGNWLTRKVELNVSTHMKFISLELVVKR
jgi:hypothetical protein